MHQRFMIFYDVITLIFIHKIPRRLILFARKNSLYYKILSHKRKINYDRYSNKIFKLIQLAL